MFLPQNSLGNSKSHNALVLVPSVNPKQQIVAAAVLIVQKIALIAETIAKQGIQPDLKEKRFMSGFY